MTPSAFTTNTHGSEGNVHSDTAGTTISSSKLAASRFSKTSTCTKLAPGNSLAIPFTTSSVGPQVAVVQNAGVANTITDGRPDITASATLSS